MKRIALAVTLVLVMCCAAALADQQLDTGFFSMTLGDEMTYETYPEYTEGTRPLVIVKPFPGDPEMTITALFREGAGDITAMSDPVAQHVIPYLESMKAAYADGSNSIILDKYEIIGTELVDFSGRTGLVVRYALTFSYTDSEGSQHNECCDVFLPVSGGTVEISALAGSAEALAAYCLPVLRTIR